MVKLCKKKIGVRNSSICFDDYNGRENGKTDGASGGLVIKKRSVKGGSRFSQEKDFVLEEKEDGEWKVGEKVNMEKINNRYSTTE